MPPIPYIEPELLRQRGRLVWLLEKLDDKNLEKTEANARLMARRRSYVPKNNGKGRPAKAFRLFSKEDEARRVQYIAEIRLLDDVLERDRDCSAIAWLKAAFDPKAEDDPAARFRQAKIVKLLEQFSVRTVDLRTPRPWSANNVRAFLHVAKQRQVGRLDYFRRVPVRTAAEQACEARERAGMVILEWLIGSHHVETATNFLTYLEILRQDGPPPSSNHALTNQSWSGWLDVFVAEVAKRFQLPEAV